MTVPIANRLQYLCNWIERYMCQYCIQKGRLCRLSTAVDFISLSCQQVYLLKMSSFVPVKPHLREVLLYYWREVCRNLIN